MNYLENSRDYLIHYGVLGMKWGVRKSNRRARKATRKQNKAQKALKKALKKVSKTGYARSEDSRIANKIRSKPVAAMSNAELKTVINRMQLEAQYSNLSSQKLKTGKAKIDSILSYADTANKIVSTTTTAVGLINSIKNRKAEKPS